MGNVGRKPRVTDDELLDEIFELTNTNENPVVTTQEVTDVLPLKKPSVYDRLNKLHDDGKLLKKKVGAKGAVWWLSLEEKTSQS